MICLNLPKCCPLRLKYAASDVEGDDVGVHQLVAGGPQEVSQEVLDVHGGEVVLDHTADSGEHQRF